MFLFKWLTKQRKGKISGALPQQVSSEPPVGNDFAARLGWFRQQLNKCSDVKFHEVQLPGNIPFALIYIEGLIDQKLLQEQVLSPLQFELTGQSAQELLHQIVELKRLPVSYLETSTELNKALYALFEGTIVCLMDSEPQLVLFPMKSVEIRSIQQAENENVIRGPKEAFVEDIATNITMIRRRIKHPALKTEHCEFGKYTRTAVVICYVEGLCKQTLVDEVKERLSRIDIDSVLGSSYIEEFIEDNPFSPFPQVQYTERPDTLSAALLEGRVAIMVDGTPIPIIVPVTLYMLLQSAEDYYQRFIAATWIRWIRFIFFAGFISAALGLYRGNDVPSGDAASEFIGHGGCGPRECSFSRYRRGVHYGNYVRRPQGSRTPDSEADRTNRFHYRSFGDRAGGRSGRHRFRSDGYCRVHYGHSLFHHTAFRSRADLSSPALPGHDPCRELRFIRCDHQYSADLYSPGIAPVLRHTLSFTYCAYRV